MAAAWAWGERLGRGRAVLHGRALERCVAPGPFVATAGVQTDKTAESIQETVKELRGLAGSRQPTDSEIRFAKDSLVLTLAAALAGLAVAGTGIQLARVVSPDLPHIADASLDARRHAETVQLDLMQPLRP